ncbi:hypothetical protein PMIN06_003359 [Paraphaeosphaeria minitans]
MHSCLLVLILRVFPKRHARPVLPGTGQELPLPTPRPFLSYASPAFRFSCQNTPPSIRQVGNRQSNTQSTPEDYKKSNMWRMYQGETLAIQDTEILDARGGRVDQDKE